MTKRKAYPLRINEDILNAMQQWADDELRSVNAQIEYVLRDALIEAGRVKPVAAVAIAATDDSDKEKHKA